MNEYERFIESKSLTIEAAGIDVNESDINPMLFDFQRDVTRWALRKGRACIFADCGMGKTFMELEWARLVAERAAGKVLILAPLAVSQQTVREGRKLGVEVVYCRSQEAADESRCPIIITNYEMLDHFNPGSWAGLVCDESSIISDYTGKTSQAILDFGAAIPFRLFCTATPARNDWSELLMHAEAVGAMTRSEALSRWGVHDGGETQKWRLKGHAVNDFWRWVCEWAVMFGRPSDLGYDDRDFILPPIEYHDVVVDTESAGDFLIPMDAQTLQERLSARRDTIDERAEATARIVASKPGEPWLIWCNLNAEADAACRLIADAVNVQGADSAESKESAMLGFSDGSVRVLVTKPTIAGHGMNWQHCANVVFLGLSDSWEQYYQAVRRCWRFGQTRTVHVHVVTASIEGNVVANIRRKEADSIAMAASMVHHMADINSANIRGTVKMVADYRRETEHGDNWTMHLGDCIDAAKDLAENSIGFSVFSPPFASLYTYSNSPRDMGNCANDDEFMAHFRYLVAELFRVTMPGRLCSFHCMNLPTSKARHGYIGIRDFRGLLIRTFEEYGWIFHSEVCIWKDPVTAMQRTKALGLLHKQVCKDSCMSRQGIPDYLVTMRKPGDNNSPVSGDLIEKYRASTDGDLGVDRWRELCGMAGKNMSIDLWQLYASPVWMDINPSRTLQKESAREEQDERHICPLQLDVIERACVLWSNPGDVVLSPYAGIGSEGYVAIKMGRRFVGVELKESYYRQAVANLRAAESDMRQDDLFSTAITDSQGVIER